MMRRISAALALVVTLGVVVSRGQVRDGGVASVGTGVISGTVVTDDAARRPLARAVVTLTAAELPVPRTAVTDDLGRFVVRRLPAGRFTITSIKQGYVSGAFGARQMGRPGTPVMLTAGQTFDATVSMAPAGVATGVIRDERGQPLAGLRVFALDAERPVAPESVGGNPSGSPGIGVETDDRGVFRIFNLVPGNYIVVATPSFYVNGDILRPSTSEVDRVFGLLSARGSSASAAPAQPPITLTTAASPQALAVFYFPGTPVMADATHVTIGRGEVREGLDFVVRAVPVTTIEGTVINPSGTLPPYISMSIVPGNTLRFFALAGANPQLTRKPDGTGTFTYSTIVPDHYKIVVRAGLLPEPGIGAGGLTAAGVPAGVMTGTDTMYATEEVDVTGQPVTGVALRLQRGSAFSGRIVFDAATQTVPADLTGIRVTVQPRDSRSSTVGGTVIGSNLSSRQYMQLRADGTFEFPGLAPDAYQILCTVPAAAGSGWWLRSATVAGRDALDTSLTLSPGVDVKDVVLTLTDRHSELNGSLQTPAGAPATDYFAVALPADQALRIPGSRRIASTRPGTDGKFKFVDLPAGDYLLVALTDLLPTDLQQASFLSEIARAGVRVSLGQGEKKTQDLRIER